MADESNTPGQLDTTQAAPAVAEPAAPVEDAASAPTTPTAPEVVDESGPELPDLPVAPVTEQFPALAGTPEGVAREIANRTPDGGNGVRFARTFTVSGIGIPTDHPMHLANAAGVVQDAIQRGLHPRGDVYLTRVVEHDEPLNASGTRRSQTSELTYEVDVIPASVDTAPQDTTTPNVIYQAGGTG